MLRAPPARLPAPQAARVLVVGDVMLDEFLRGDVDRLSPEAPVPVLRPRSSQHALGGAANVAANLRALGACVRMVGAVGDDEAGRRVAALLAGAGVASGDLTVAAGRPTAHKLRVVAQVQHLVRIDREEIGPYAAAVEADVLARLRAEVPRCDVVVASDYGKGLLSPALLAELFATARAAGVPVAVDPKGRDYARYRGATFLTPNLRELELACGQRLADVPARDRAARATLELTGAAALLVTCGKDGMICYCADGSRVAIGAAGREVFDVTGAGDTVIATFALAVAGGAAPEPAARLANLAAGLAVAHLGTAAIGRDELLAAADAAQGCGDAKVMPLGAAAQRAAAARALGRRVVVTNGCFDLLHAGHVSYLQAARAMGDMLIVGLNSDASVRGLKGPTRPLVPEAERALVLAALGCVDAVVVFDAPTPQALMAALRPDVLVKGADYAGREVVGRDIVEACGGEVVLVPLMQGRSTSGLVQAIVQRCAPAARPPAPPAEADADGAPRLD